MCIIWNDNRDSGTNVVEGFLVSVVWVNEWFVNGTNASKMVMNDTMLPDDVKVEVEKVKNQWKSGSEKINSEKVEEVKRAKHY